MKLFVALFLCLIILLMLSACIKISQPSNAAGISNQWPASSRILTGATYVYFPTSGAQVHAGSTLTLSWSADGDLEGFILTENQYNNFKQSGVVSARMAYGAGSNVNIQTKIQNADRYYAVVRNTFTFGSSVKLYEAVLKEQ